MLYLTNVIVLGIRVHVVLCTIQLYYIHHKGLMTIKTGALIVGLLKIGKGGPKIKNKAFTMTFKNLEQFLK